MFRLSSTTSKSSGLATPHFPTYLIPSLKIPFLRRRRQSSTTTNDVPSLCSSPVSATSADGDDDLPSPSTNTNTSPYEMLDDKPSFKPFSVTQQPAPREPTRDRLARVLPDVLRCNTCGTDVAYGLQIVSKGFTGRHGRALLVSAPLSSSQPSCPGSDYHLPPPPMTTTTSTRRSASPGNGSGSGSSGSNTPILSPGHHALARDGANLVNITVGRPESRNLVTGAHVVADINCATCGIKIGWKYVDAREQTQKYKVGKFILETERVVLFHSWEDVPAGGTDLRDDHFYSASAPASGFGARRRSSAFGADRKVSCSSEGKGRVDGYVVEGEDEQGSGESESEEEVVFDSDDEDECEDIFAGVWDAATVARRRGSRVSSGKRYDAKKGRATDGSP